jgi:hypothetical protein
VSYCESVAESAPNTPLFYYHFPGKPPPLGHPLLVSLVSHTLTHALSRTHVRWILCCNSSGMVGVNIPLYDFFAAASSRIPTLRGSLPHLALLSLACSTQQRFLGAKFTDSQLGDFFRALCYAGAPPVCVCLLA